MKTYKGKDMKTTAQIQEDIFDTLGAIISPYAKTLPKEKRLSLDTVEDYIVQEIIDCGDDDFFREFTVTIKGVGELHFEVNATMVFDRRNYRDTPPEVVGLYIYNLQVSDVYMLCPDMDKSIEYKINENNIIRKLRRELGL